MSRDPKILLSNPIGVVTHSLRSPALKHYFVEIETLVYFSRLIGIFLFFYVDICIAASNTPAEPSGLFQLFFFTAGGFV